MKQAEKQCDECESPYFDGTSEMKNLCNECSHVLYGYPQCEHTFCGGTCAKCGWNGSHSEFIVNLLKRHNMTDKELSDELLYLAKKVKEIARFQEVECIMGTLVSKPLQMVALNCEWRMAEYAETADGLTDLTVLLNNQVVVKVGISNLVEEPVEHSRPILVADYLETASSSQSRQLQIAMETIGLTFR
jgi:hypothetical protein